MAASRFGAFRQLWDVLNTMLIQDPGVGDMPELPFFLGGHHKLPVVISRDATGKGNLQLTTAAMRNPYASKSAQHLRILGLGNVDDGRDGTKRLFGPQNLKAITRLVEAD